MISVSATSKVPVVSEARSHLTGIAFLKVVALVALFVFAAIFEAHNLQSLGNPTSWLHLRVGSWITEHRAIPRLGIFSQSTDSTWADPNWSLQLVADVFYRVLGLRVLPLAVMVFRLSFAVLTFVLAGGRRGNFWPAVLISMCAQVALLTTSLPTSPYLAVLFATELLLLFQSRRSGHESLLYWVPVLILVWVNLDWSFVFGTAALLLYCGASAIEPILQKRNWHFSLGGRAALPPARLGAIAVATCVASLISPYFYSPYLTAWQNLFGVSPVVNSFPMRSLNFRQPQHYLLMLLAMFAALALGRRHLRDLFPLLLLVASGAVSFAFGREAWVVVVVSVAVLGDFFLADDSSPVRAEASAKLFWPAVTMAAVVIVAAMASIPSNPEELLNVASRKLPVRACDFIRQNHLPGPIYNEMDWGDFIAWYLPQYPVSIDDRYELYGEEKTSLYYGVNRAKVIPSSDPAFAAANTVILSARSGLVSGVEMFPNAEEVFRLTYPGLHEVYRDKLAVVLSR
jgi:hypothetical protein